MFTCVFNSKEYFSENWGKCFFFFLLQYYVLYLNLGNLREIFFKFKEGDEWGNRKRVNWKMFFKFKAILLNFEETSQI